MLSHYIDAKIMLSVAWSSSKVFHVQFTPGEKCQTQHLQVVAKILILWKRLFFNGLTLFSWGKMSSHWHMSA